MKQKMFTSIILVFIGVLVGLFILTSYQFHKRLSSLENFVVNNDKDISIIENFINTNLVKNTNKGKTGNGN
jgi:multisubunit Na+/H+ antiporter MnhB subunit